MELEAPPTVLPPPFLAQKAPQVVPLPIPPHCRRRPPPCQPVCCFGGISAGHLLAVFIRYGVHVHVMREGTGC